MITRSWQCRTVVDLVRLRADIAGDRPAYTYLTDGEAEERTLTWHDVDVGARALAAWLGRLSGRSERMVLLFPTGLEFVTAFFGCLYAGVAAVPAYPLDPLHLARTRARLRLMLDDCRPSRILTTTAYRGVVLSMFDDRSQLDGFEWGLVDTVPDGLASAWRPPEIDDNTLAIIQYTSGAIADPKGVLVSHRNVLANEAMIAGAHGYDIEATFVSWLPLAHDWGLINSILQPAYSGGRSVLMSTEAFLERPVRWLRAISGRSAVSSGGPNFAYDFCCRRIAPEQRIGLDLAGWRWAGVGSGPVSSETLAAFSSAFQPFGFTASAFYSGYGLAEATLLVSDSQRFQVPRALTVDRVSLQKGLILPRVAVDSSTTQSFTSCGTPPAVERVRIVDPETRAVRPDDQVGEIWVAGDNVAGGYWNRPEESQQTFGGITADGDGPFLRTGDLGFFHHGELYICGRLKDLIIIRGRNIYPHDIELTAEHSHPSARPGSSAAFAIGAAADERIVVLQELRPAAPGSPRHDMEIAHAIRTAIVEVHGVIAEVVLVEPGTIRKTSSGKLQRNACRDAFIAGELDVRDHQTPAKKQGRLHLKGGSRLPTLAPAGPQTIGLRLAKIKIRGHTVDLAEVEAGLAACAGVTKAAVLAVGGEAPTEPGRLVAYVVVGREAERNAPLIRRRLASLLPSYMLPDGYVFLDALPLTASGKIDRGALGAVAPPEANGEREIEPPRDDLERSIAGIFEQMLKLEPIGRDDDFFLLGGDSLSVVELQMRLRDTFGAALANPSGGATVAGIAAEIRRERAAAGGSVRSIPLLIPLRRHGTKPPLFLVHGRLGQALVSPHFLKLLGADQPVWGFQATGLDGVRSPQPTIEAMAAEYLAEMRRERPQGPYFLGGLCAGALVAIVMGRRLRAEGESVLPLLLLDAPERAFPVSAEKLTDDGLLARLKRRQESGAISAPIDDPVYAGAVVRAARAFEHAIRVHQVQPYDGPVCLLSSHERMGRIDSSRLKKTFTGPVERFEVGRTHPEVLDPRNRAFAKALERCLRVIHGYAADPRLAHLARADSPNAIP